MMMKPIFLLFLLFFPPFAYGIEGEGDDQIQVHEGNFSLPLSQQPAPLVSFGQFITTKGVLEFFSYVDVILGSKYFFTDIIPTILYGLSDKASIYVEVPFSAANRDHNYRSAGLQDLVVYYEYAFYTKATKYTNDQATIVLAMSIPTSSLRKNPVMGYGSPGFFVGLTYTHVAVWWEAFVSPGVILTTQRAGLKFGDAYLYQCGLEGVLCAQNQSLLAWYLEFDGTYVEKTWYNGSYDPNSGGNIILLTPSLCYANEKYFFQGGVSVPIQESLNGKQSRTNVIFRVVGGFAF